MSLDKQDWKYFDVLSGQLSIGDAASGEGVVCNAENGSWVAMCEYDDDHRIKLVAAMRENMAALISGGKVEVEQGTSEMVTFDSESGVVFMVDRKVKGNLPKCFEIPEGKLNKDIVEMYGRPNDEGKAEQDRFVESCFHMARDSDSSMPSLNSLMFGAVAELPRGEISVEMLYNPMRDVIGFEIERA